MAPHLRFVDTCAPGPYADANDLAGLGGTEATQLRIVGGLAPTTTITVEQAARTDRVERNGVDFAPADLTARFGDTIIVINSWKVALALARRNPAARDCVWQHVVPGRHNPVPGGDLAGTGIAIPGVSSSLCAMIAAMLDAPVDMHVLHNPVEDALLPDCALRHPDLLVFASARHKGLDQVLMAFSALRARIPALRLELGDPGYLVWPLGELPPGVTRLGCLTHPDGIAKMRQALCLLYPQQRFAETFGLVIAEASAAGTPALLHRGPGANDEVASGPDQCIDATRPDQIADRIITWRESRPQVRMLPEFRLSHVVSRWQRMLHTTRLSAAA